ncbi:DUF21 domain-containing protein [Candidatus Micrarchaeota archaeon]|nr:DUF21 domain-containing protein [Candidatus Micrarchaeota archaeon]
MDIYFYFGLFAAFLSISALFSVMEASFISLSALHAKRLFKQGKPNAEALVKLRERPRRVLITILLWNNAANVAATAVATYGATKSFGSPWAGLVLGAVAIALLLFGDVIPKIFAILRHERMALALAPLLRALVLVTAPLVAPIEMLAQSVSGKESKRPLLTEEDVEALVAIAVEEGTVGENEAKIVRRALDFNEYTAEQVMRPVKDVEAISPQTTVSEALLKSVASTHHRFPVMGQNGEAVGTVNEKRLLEASQNGRGGVAVREITRPPLLVQPSARISVVFETLKKSRRRMAVVVDGKSKMIGLVTLEDILQKLVEEIHGFD